MAPQQTLNGADLLALLVIKSKYWPQGYCCPNCSTPPHNPIDSIVAGTQCAKCGYDWSFRDGTPMEGTRSPLAAWAVAIAWRDLTGEAPSVQLVQEQGGVSERTARRIVDGTEPRITIRESGLHPQLKQAPVRDLSERARIPVIAVPALIVLLFAGIAATAISVSRSRPHASTDTSIVTPHPQIDGYVGRVIEEDGSSYHVSVVLGVRLETALRDGEELHKSMDRHLLRAGGLRGRLANMIRRGEPLPKSAKDLDPPVSLLAE